LSACIKIQRKFLNIYFTIFILMPGLSFTQKTNSTKNTLDFKTTSDKPMATLVNINNISMWAHADGLSARSPYKKKWA